MVAQSFLYKLLDLLKSSRAVLICSLFLVGAVSNSIVVAGPYGNELVAENRTPSPGPYGNE